MAAIRDAVELAPSHQISSSPLNPAEKPSNPGHPSFVLRQALRPSKIDHFTPFPPEQASAPPSGATVSPGTQWLMPFSTRICRTRTSYWVSFACHFRPMYARANMGHPSRSRYDTDSVGWTNGSVCRSDDPSWCNQAYSSGLRSGLPRWRNLAGDEWLMVFR
jgi:hypothetical protein